MTVFDKDKQYQLYFKSFLGSWSFKDGDEVLTIADIRDVEMYDQRTGSTKTEPCVFFEEIDLPLVLNVTNAETIANVTGSDIPRDWVGKKIKVGSEKVRVGGKLTTGIRVKNEVIKPHEPLSPAQKEKILDMADAGQIDLTKMLKFYKVETIDEINREQARSMIIAKTGEVIE